MSAGMRPMASRTPSIVLFGPMGIGKSTAIRTLCGSAMVDCDVENLDKASHAKATTTVGADFGVIELGDGQRLRIYGSPGQERFSFMRNYLMSVAIGAIVMVDIGAGDALAHTAALLQELEALPTSPMVMVVIARAAADADIDFFCDQLAQRVGWAVPAIAADVREREQMLNVLQVLITMLSIDSEETV